MPIEQSCQQPKFAVQRTGRVGQVRPRPDLPDGPVGGIDEIRDFQFGSDYLDMSLAAYGLEQQGKDPIQVIDNADGVLFVVQDGHSVLVRGADLSDFQAGDYNIDSPF